MIFEWPPVGGRCSATVQACGISGWLPGELFGPREAHSRLTYKAPLPGELQPDLYIPEAMLEVRRSEGTQLIARLAFRKRGASRNAPTGLSYIPSVYTRIRRMHLRAAHH